MSLEEPTARFYMNMVNLCLVKFMNDILNILSNHMSSSFNSTQVACHWETNRAMTETRHADIRRYA